jgi:hypothetical protein
MDLFLDRTNNDLELTADGDLRTIDEKELVAQAIYNTLLTRRGEWMFDLSFGVPYRGTIITRTPNLDVIQATIRAIVMSVEGVNSILQLETAWNKATRLLTVTITVDTPWGLAPQVVV